MQRFISLDFSGFVVRGLGRCHYAQRAARTALVGLTALFCASTQIRADTQAFTVSGRVSYGLTNGGITVVFREDTFDILVDGRRWLLNTRPVTFLKHGEVRKDIGFVSTVSSDATNLYSLTTFLPNVPIRRLLRTNASATIYSTTASTNSGAGLVAKGAVPYAIPDTKVYVLWYAFASGGYLAATEDGFIHPLAPLDQPGDYAKDFRVRAEWVLSSTHPRVPLWIKFTSYRKWMDSGDRSSKTALRFPADYCPLRSRHPRCHCRRHS